MCHLLMLAEGLEFPDPRVSLGAYGMSGGRGGAGGGAGGRGGPKGRGMGAATGARMLRPRGAVGGRGGRGAGGSLGPLWKDGSDGVDPGGTAGGGCGGSCGSSGGSGVPEVKSSGVRLPYSAMRVWLKVYGMPRAVHSSLVTVEPPAPTPPVPPRHVAAISLNRLTHGSVPCSSSNAPSASMPTGRHVAVALLHAHCTAPTCCGHSACVLARVQRALHQKNLLPTGHEVPVKAWWPTRLASATAPPVLRSVRVEPLVPYSRSSCCAGISGLGGGQRTRDTERASWSQGVQAGRGQITKAVYGTVVP